MVSPGPCFIVGPGDSTVTDPPLLLYPFTTCSPDNDPYYGTDLVCDDLSTEVGFKE